MSLAFMKSGADAHEEMKKADAAQQAAWEAASGPQRFWLEKGKEARVTFLDGAVVDGLLQSVSWYEHMVPRGAGKKGWDTYPCTQETEACPICEGGNQPSLVFAFTIIDHRSWKDKQGKEHTFQKRLFVCKRESFKLLQAKALKLMSSEKAIDGTLMPAKATNGLVGVTFDITRIGEKSASVGSDFDYVACTPLPQIYAACKYEAKDQGAYPYGEVIKYFPAAELRGMGFGVSGAVGSADTKASGATEKAANSASPFQVGSPFNPAKEL